MKVSNKKILYTVENTNPELKLGGLVSVNDQNLIENFNGQIYKINDDFVGSFYYSESPELKVNKNLSSCPLEDLAKATLIIDETISEIKKGIK